MNAYQYELLKTGVNKWNKWRNENPNEKINLRDANMMLSDLDMVDLNKADLRGANLRGANLREANLRGANLASALLAEADLSDADLRGADLKKTILVDAEMTNADLSDADLREADLTKANQRGVDLDGAILDGSEGIRTYAHESTYNVQRDQLNKERKQANSRLETLLKRIVKGDEDNELLQKKIAEQEAIIKGVNLDEGILEALDAIKQSIAETDRGIEQFRIKSEKTYEMGVNAYVLAAVYSIAMMVYLRWVGVPENLGEWFISIAPSFILLTAGTGLLRLDTKLQAHYEHLSKNKHLLEKAAGVLQASNHLTQVEGIETKHPIVIRTFETVKNALLNQSPDKENYESDSEIESTEYKAVVNNLVRQVISNITKN